MYLFVVWFAARLSISLTAYFFCNIFCCCFIYAFRCVSLNNCLRFLGLFIRVFCLKPNVVFTFCLRQIPPHFITLAHTQEYKNLCEKSLYI